MPAEEQVRAPLPVVTERLVGNILPSVSRPRSVREIGEGGGAYGSQGGTGKEARMCISSKIHSIHYVHQVHGSIHIHPSL